MTQSRCPDDSRIRIEHLPSIVEVIPKMSDPLFVTGLPLEWRSHNGRYNPIKNYGPDKPRGFGEIDKIDVQWTCAHDAYWGFKICPMIIEYGHYLQKWTLAAYHADLGWHPVFEGKVPYGFTNHPCFAQWPNGICVSTNQPTFWQTL